MTKTLQHDIKVIIFSTLKTVPFVYMLKFCAKSFVVLHRCDRYLLHVISL